jgi:hypothetical protein
MDAHKSEPHPANAVSEENSGVALAWGLGLGIGIGTAIGFATGELGFWLAIGTAIGVGAQGLALLFKR